MATNEEEQSKELKNMGKKLVESQMQNVELEQDIAILRKKFRELLASKGMGPEGAEGAARSAP